MVTIVEMPLCDISKLIEINEWLLVNVGESQTAVDEPLTEDKSWQIDIHPISLDIFVSFLYSHDALMFKLICG